MCVLFIYTDIKNIKINDNKSSKRPASQPARKTWLKQNKEVAAATERGKKPRERPQRQQHLSVINI